MSDTNRSGDTRELVIDEHALPRSDHPRVLITNDDGIDSPGIESLALSLSEEFETVVVAPAWDMSGSGTGIGHIDPSQGVALTKRDRAEFEAYTIAGPPGLAVLAAMLGGFGPTPDLVVSGVNAGLNTGRSVLHSGTVGAALTARTFGIPGLAVSLESSDPWHWDTAVTAARSAVRWMLARQGPPCVLNLNAPARPLEDVTGIHWADLDEFGHIRVAMADVPGERLDFDVSGSGSGLDPACDTALVLAGNVTLTMLSPMNPAPFPAEEPTAVWNPLSQTANEPV
ncbi:MAG: 5'/3'-nucleotidase SurE [Acidimicrobiia bacterium]